MIGMEKRALFGFSPSLIFSFSPFIESIMPQGRDEQSLMSLLLFCC